MHSLVRNQAQSDSGAARSDSDDCHGSIVSSKTIQVWFVAGQHDATSVLGCSRNAVGINYVSTSCTRSGEHATNEPSKTSIGVAHNDRTLSTHGGIDRGTQP